MPVPGAALRLLLGEMAHELLLNGQRVLPSALVEAGFGFRYPHVESALAGIFNGHAGVRLP
jgi:NAD dependent epimerase/dehydratase family enzyme